MSVNFHLIVDLCTPIYLSTHNHNHNHRHQCGSSPVAIHPSIAQGAAAVGWIASEASRVSSSLPPNTRLTPNNKLKKSQIMVVKEVIRTCNQQSYRASFIKLPICPFYTPRVSWSWELSWRGLRSCTVVPNIKSRHGQTFRGSCPVSATFDVNVIGRTITTTEPL